MTPAEFSQWCFSASEALALGAQAELDVQAPALMRDFQNRSPVDSGEYKAGWKEYSPSRYRVDAIVGIRNQTKHYNVFMEYGAEKHRAPWFYPSKRKRSGKLRVINGRVWAGGLNPGHKGTRGGAIGPALTNNSVRLNRLTRSVAEEMMRWL